MIVATKAVSINVSPDRVWDAMTSSNEVSRAIFEATIESDWQRGSPIVYKGLDGRLLDERGVILDIDPPLFLRVGYPATTGASLAAANSNTITHALSRDGKLTRLTVTHSFTATAPEAQVRAEANWASWLDALKAMLEG